MANRRFGIQILLAAVGVVAGAGTALLFVVIMYRGPHGNINPQSLAGIINAIVAAALGMLAGAAINRLPRLVARVTLATAVALLAFLGVTGIILNSLREFYEAMVFAFVIAPGCLLGYALAPPRPTKTADAGV